MTLPLTTLIIARNEAEQIDRAVRSASPLGKVLVVDGGSTDETIARARAAGADVVSNAWPGFVAQRRFAIAQCKTEWALFLDADEAVTPDLASEISSLDPRHDGYLIRRRNLFLGRWMEHGAWGRDRVLRLFRRGKASLADRAVHETVSIDGSVGVLHHHLLHYAQNDFGTIGRKFADYIPLQAEEIAKRGRRINMFSVLISAKASFLRDYILRRGFLDGWQGLVLAFWGSASVVAKYAEAKRRM